jgi:hypothetical protein
MRLLKNSEISTIAGAADNCVCSFNVLNERYNTLATCGCVFSFGLSSICWPIDGCGKRGHENTWNNIRKTYNTQNIDKCREICCKPYINVQQGALYSFGDSIMYNCS